MVLSNKIEPSRIRTLKSHLTLGVNSRKKQVAQSKKTQKLAILSAVGKVPMVNIFSPFENIYSCWLK